MSESTSPIDQAWSVVEESAVNKAIPLIPILAGAAFGGMGAAQGSGFRLGDETGFNPGFHADAGFYDPVTGGYLGQTSTESIGLDDQSVGGRLAGGAVGSLQAVNPVAVLGLAGRGVRGASYANRANRAVRAAPTPQAANIARFNTGRRPVRNFVGRGLDNMSQSKTLRGLGRLSQLSGNMASQFGDAAGALTGYLGLGGLDALGSDQGSGIPQMGGSGSSTFGLGQTDAGMGDISNVQSSSVLDREIWNPNEGSAFEQQAEYGGTRKSVGEFMFTNNKGDEIKKQVEEMFYKARCAGCAKPECIGKMSCPYGEGKEMATKAECPKCGKENCVNKMGCTVKAEDEGKKPAHGMVIVIGSKNAKPGPSEDGKRKKLDSEKKEE